MTHDGIEVHGGAGGTAAVLDSLRQGVHRLRVAADLLDDAAQSARRADAQVDGGTWSSAGAPSSTAHRARDAVTPLLHGPASLPAGAEAVREVAGRLEGAMTAYLDAEALAHALVRRLVAAWGHSAGNSPLLAALGAVVVGRGILTATALTVLGGQVSGRRVDLHALLLRTDVAELAVQGVAGAGTGLGPGPGRPTAAPAVGASQLMTTGATGAGVLVPALRRRPLRVTPRLEATRAVAPPVDATDLLVRVGALYPRSGGTAGTVGVERLDHPDGTRAWVVAIPGTQVMSPGTAGNPMDMATNVRLMAAAPDDASELVTRALEQSGARPGEPVLLAGHSQGGMVAMALAGSAAFTQRHRVAAVLTAGSPVATMPVPSGTAVLHLEHRQDLVPALDGWSNPDRPHRTTAVRDLASARTVDDRIAARSPGAAHEIGTYARTARAVTAAGGPSVRSWERAAAQVLGGPGTVAVHREFSGARAVPGGQVLAPGPEWATGRGVGRASPVGSPG